MTIWYYTSILIIHSNQVIQIPVIIQETNICIFKDLSIFLLISQYIIALKNCNIIFWIITLLKKSFWEIVVNHSFCLLLHVHVYCIYTSNLRRWDGENMNKSKDRNISEKKQSLKSGRRGHIKDIKITLNNTSGDPWNSLCPSWFPEFFFHYSHFWKTFYRYASIYNLVSTSHALLPFIIYKWFKQEIQKPH